MANIEHITELEMQLTHIARQSDELSDIVADQAKRIEVLERRLLALMERAAADEASSAGSVMLGDQRPPHW